MYGQKNIAVFRFIEETADRRHSTGQTDNTRQQNYKKQQQQKKFEEKMKD
jgi:hypothetical protein